MVVKLHLVASLGSCFNLPHLPIPARIVLRYWSRSVCLTCPPGRVGRETTNSKRQLTVVQLAAMWRCSCCSPRCSSSSYYEANHPFHLFNIPNWDLASPKGNKHLWHAQPPKVGKARSKPPQDKTPRLGIGKTDWTRSTITNVSTHVSGGKEEKTLLTRAVAGPSKPLQEEKTYNLNATIYVSHLQSKSSPWNTCEQRLCLMHIKLWSVAIILNDLLKMIPNIIATTIISRSSEGSTHPSWLPN